MNEPEVNLPDVTKSELNEGGQGHPASALSALLDGELTYEEETTVQTHLMGCSTCRLELDDVRMARSWLRALPPVDPPFGYLERLTLTPAHSQWRDSQWRNSQWRRVAMASAGAAAVIAATVVGVAPAQKPAGPATPNLVNATVPTLVTTTLATTTLVTSTTVNPFVPVLFPVNPLIP